MAVAASAASPHLIVAWEIPRENKGISIIKLAIFNSKTLSVMLLVLVNTEQTSMSTDTGRPPPRSVQVEVYQRLTA